MKDNPVRKLMQLFDQAAQAWFETYEAPGIEGRPVIAEVSREVQQPTTLRAALLNKGATAASVADKADLAAAIAADAPVVRRAARTGWLDDNTCFVGHRFVSPESAEKALIPPACPLVGAAGQLQIRGTLKGWRKLAAIARYSTAMTLALCGPFAAPLLALLHRPSFALVFFGPSKIGKSFAQLTAASAIGFGSEKDLLSCNASPAGLLSAAMSFNDHMFPINEIGTARGKKKNIYEGLRDNTYALMEGKDTIRHQSWQGVSPNTDSTFRTIVFLSSEISPDAWAARNGEIRDDGEMARLIGVPVLAAGCRTIFDLPPDDLEGFDLEAWEKAQFQRLHEGFPDQRGVAFAEYLDELLRDVKGETARARSLVATFEEGVGKGIVSPVARDIVSKFAVLFAGGVIAIELGILPLHKKELGHAVRRACLAALAELPDPEAELRADVKTLKTFLDGSSIIDTESCSRKALGLMQNADGYREPKGKGLLIVVRAQSFTNLFPTPHRTRRLLEWLDDEGLLEHPRGRSNKRSNEWAQTQGAWPDGTRPRSISIYLPGGLADLDRLG